MKIIPSRCRGKPSTCLPRMDPGAKEESSTTGTLRCRFREKTFRGKGLPGKSPTISPSTRSTLREYHLKVKCSTSEIALHVFWQLTALRLYLQRISSSLQVMWSGAVNRQPGDRARNLQRRGYRAPPPRSKIFSGARRHHDRKCSPDFFFLILLYVYLHTYKKKKKTHFR